MKVLTIARPLPDAAPPSAAVVRAAKEWIDEHRRNGTIDCIYGFMTGGGVSISNADSPDECHRLLMSYPMHAWMAFEIHPLCDIDRAFEVFLEAIQKLGG